MTDIQLLKLETRGPEGMEEEEESRNMISVQSYTYDVSVCAMKETR
jgi:hypothetical protein